MCLPFNTFFNEAWNNWGKKVHSTQNTYNHIPAGLPTLYNPHSRKRSLFYRWLKWNKRTQINTQIHIPTSPFHPYKDMYTYREGILLERITLRFFIFSLSFNGKYVSYVYMVGTVLWFYPVRKQLNLPLKQLKST